MDTGVIKEIDQIGRLVIPKEFRERFNLINEVEILATENGVLIRNPEYILVKKRPPVRNKVGGCSSLRSPIHSIT